ncbi:F0F1 ATP synthase subunit delta [Solimicrobium silvestre]|uniref:ATP synthase subunit delta n=1 Tax=Solimicrobium silvestre TaxID=2099400 RepID=A0A2S9GSF4_9BURK|nr:F0F1 ATP synthase subunit delta [Solimicrobium silvestre]PRC90643.1 ATP synthase F1, delta subunit [Solimicrobium silvestre]
MAEIATIARPYAEALFRVAKTNLSAWAELVEEMSQAAQHADVKALVQNPKVPATMVADTFLSVLKSPVNQEAKNFINTLASNHRLLVLPEIAAQFHALKNAHEGAADAVISSAFALSDAQVSTLCATLEARFGRKLNPSVTVDAALIGGVRVVVGDEVLDTSVRAKLQKMQLALTA